MCISRCHIIFWGDKTIINLGITSWNVILQNVNVTNHEVRRHDLLCVGCNVMMSYVEVLKWYVSLRRMLVCCRELYVYQGFPVISMMDREHLSQLFCYWGTRWWNILKLSYEQQRCHSSTTSDWWTIYICEFSVSGWRPSSRHLYCLRSGMLLLQLLLMEHFFRHPSTIFLICNLVNDHSSAGRRRLPHQDCS